MKALSDSESMFDVMSDSDRGDADSAFDSSYSGEFKI